jgi:O-antigen ligase
VLLAGAFAAVALIVTLATRPSLTAVAFGAKTDLEFLVAFVLATTVATPRFNQRLTGVILGAAVAVIGFGALQSTVLPPNFLTRFGYGPGTVPPFLVLDPAIKSLRFASTLGGPNQLGTYLMLPLALAATLAFRRRQWWALALVAGGAFVVLHTYSRSAWIGVAAATITITLILTPRRARAAVAALIALLGVTGAFIATWLLKLGGNLQYYLLHSSALWHGARGSDYDHLNSLREGLTLTIARPFGHGLGTAGPATFHTGTGLIIENNYLQLSYETGFLGALLFIALVLATARELLAKAAHSDLAAATLAALIGISVTALVLPAWTDSTTALIVWITAGAVIGSPPAGSRHV